MHANQTPVTTSPNPSAHFPALTRPVRPEAAPATATEPDADAGPDARPAPATPADEAEEAGYGYGV